MPEKNIEQLSPENIANPERGLETGRELPSLPVERVSSESDLTPVVGAPNLDYPQPRTVTSSYQDARIKEIEAILEEDLADYYFQLPDETKLTFKTEGELTAKKINALLSETKVAVQKIIDLIKVWLSVLPGVNKFFVEQEAKIKTDKILFIKQ